MTILESFAGIGRHGEGVKSAIENLTANSLHVMPSALWNDGDAAQVSTGTWHIAEAPFTAVIGHPGMRSSVPTMPAPPDGLFNQLHEAIGSEALTPGLHGFRFYVASLRGALTFESLRDNEPWLPGIATLKSLAWEPADGFYSARLFLVLKPVEPSAS